MPTGRTVQGQGSKWQLSTINPLAVVPTVGWQTTFRPADQEAALTSKSTLSPIRGRSMADGSAAVHQSLLILQRWPFQTQSCLCLNILTGIFLSLLGPEFWADMGSPWLTGTARP